MTPTPSAREVACIRERYIDGVTHPDDIRDILAAYDALAAEREAVKARLADLLEPYTDEHGHTWERPTTYAYARACIALENKRLELAAAERERDALRGVVEKARAWVRAGDLVEQLDGGRGSNDARHEMDAAENALIDAVRALDERAALNAAPSDA